MSVDIVNLIENNPITKFTGDYHSKLVEKIKKTFTNYEQQLFLSSFYCYINCDSKNDFVIDLDNVWNWLGFVQKVNAKRLLEKNFIINKDYKFLLCQSAKQTIQQKGGHNKEIFMLNLDTFKKFCLKAGTKKADEVHEYFIKLETIIFEITKEECDELKQQLQLIENIKNKEMEEKLTKQKEIEKEKILLKQFTNIGNIIYIIRVKTYKNGSYVVKIGESRRGIQNRYAEHRNKYEECLLLDCFKVDKSKEFESFLHHNSYVYPTKVTNLEGHETENELFLIGTSLTYQILLKIIEDNIDNYNYKVSELLFEIETLKNKISDNQTYNQNDDINILKQLIINMSNEIYDIKKSNQLILNKLNSQETKIVTGFNQQMPHLGPRLQKINPENMQLVKVYESVTELMNENKNIKRSSIMKSIRESTIYCGFRWFLVERNLDANIIYDIKPTKETKVQNLGYIAKLNCDKSEIINVYIDRKTAAQLNGYQNISALDNPVKNNTLTNGHYYMLYDNCNDELISKFEELYGEPLLYKNGIGQFDLNDMLIREFSCKYDVIRELKISDKTLSKALQNNIPYNDFYFKELGSKLKYL